MQELVQAGAGPAGGGQCPPSSWDPGAAPALAPALAPEAELALYVPEALAEPCSIGTQTEYAVCKLYCSYLQA